MDALPDFEMEANGFRRGEPMSVQFKIVGGTPKLGKSLCATCKHAVHAKGQNMEEVVRCRGGVFGSGSDGPSFVPFRIAECSEYHPLNMPYLYEMREIAWNIEARKRGQAGFKKEEPGDIQVVVTKPKRSHDPLDDIDE